MALKDTGPMVNVAVVAGGIATPVKALIDTGSQFSFLDCEFAQELGLATTKSITIHGAVERKRGFYTEPFVLLLGKGRLNFGSGAGMAIPMAETCGYDAIIGRDVLDHALFLYDGPKQEHTLLLVQPPAPAAETVKRTVAFRDEQGRLIGTETRKEVA